MARNRISRYLKVSPKAAAKDITLELTENSGMIKISDRGMVDGNAASLSPDLLCKIGAGYCLEATARREFEARSSSYLDRSLVACRYRIPTHSNPAEGISL